MTELEEQFGRIDIYLFDQLLRGNITHRAKILDAGCGSGRNLIYLMASGYEVFGVDKDPSAVDEVLRLAASLAPEIPESNFRAESIEAMTIPETSVDVVICSAVLHFSRDDEHFWAMLQAMWRTLEPGGFSFVGSRRRLEWKIVAGRLPDDASSHLTESSAIWWTRAYYSTPRENSAAH